jgi:hypothetical protein
MRYMFLIYSKETEEAEASPEEVRKLRDGHRAVREESIRKGIFEAGEPLQPTSTATTIRVNDGKAFAFDGPFAETKEQLAGYYILDCSDLDEAIEWAKKIPTACKGAPGCIEVRPIITLKHPS